jgi:hypothetical protein
MGCMRWSIRECESLRTFTSFLFVFSSLLLLFFHSDNLTRQQLRELCQEYGLKVTGNKCQLTDSLRVFSMDRNRWDRHVILIIT